MSSNTVFKGEHNLYLTEQKLFNVHNNASIFVDKDQCWETLTLSITVSKSLFTKCILSQIQLPS